MVFEYYSNNIRIPNYSLTSGHFVLDINSLALPKVQEDLQNIFNNEDGGGGAGLEENGNVEEPKRKKKQTDGTAKAMNARKPKAKP